MITGYDAIHTQVATIPPAPQLVLGYTGSLPAYTAEIDWTADDWARFPNARKLVIATHADADGDILDVERYDAVPADLPAWYARQKARRDAPTGFYCNTTTLPSVEPLRPPGCLSWVADWNGAADLQGWDAHQYASLANYDVSVFSDVWFPQPKELLHMIMGNDPQGHLIVVGKAIDNGNLMVFTETAPGAWSVQDVTDTIKAGNPADARVYQVD